MQNQLRMQAVIVSVGDNVFFPTLGNTHLENSPMCCCMPLGMHRMLTAAAAYTEGNPIEIRLLQCKNKLGLFMHNIVKVKSDASCDLARRTRG